MDIEDLLSEAEGLAMTGNSITIFLFTVVNRQI